MAQSGALWRIASTRMPTKWGMFDAIGFERDISNGSQRVETALDAHSFGDRRVEAALSIPLARNHAIRAERSLPAGRLEEDRGATMN